MAKANRSLLAYLLARDADETIATLTTWRNCVNDIGPAVVALDRRAKKRSRGGVRRNWRRAVAEGGG